MPGITELPSILHHIRIKLYPNYLPKGKGTYIAHTDSDKTVNVKDICTIMVTRAGFEGKLEPLYDHVSRFLDEVAYQICDGFTANLGYFTIHPNIGGIFTSEKEVHDHKKHPISFRFSMLTKLRQLAGNINIEIEGIADANGYIMEFVDIATGAVNETYTPMNQFVITGYKLKVAGDNPDVGVYFEQVNGPVKLKVTSLAENTPTKLIGMVPPGPDGTFKLVVKTQFSGSGSKFLKSPRTIESSFTLTR